jgi:CPA1 family monovalent cation:H+ antiporter
MVDTNYRHVAAATMAGLPSQCASVVSEYMEEIDLAGIGRLLAVTPNDDLNTLAAMEFAPVFGRENVYQLSPGEAMLKRREAASPNRPGRVLFSEQANYLGLASRAAGGAQVKKTRITDEFTFADFQRRYGETALVLFVLTEAKTLQISTAESPLIPKRGQTVIAFVEEAEDRSLEPNGTASP